MEYIDVGTYFTRHNISYIDKMFIYMKIYMVNIKIKKIFFNEVVIERTI